MPSISSQAVTGKERSLGPQQQMDRWTDGQTEHSWSLGFYTAKDVLGAGE